MQAKKQNEFIMPLAIMVFAAVAFIFMVRLSVENRVDEKDTNSTIVINQNTNTSTSECVKKGCSNQLCVDEDGPGFSNCEWLEWYSCLSLTKCERQANGQCGWSENQAYLDCLKGKKK